MRFRRRAADPAFGSADGPRGTAPATAARDSCACAGGVASAVPASRTAPEEATPQDGASGTDVPTGGVVAVHPEAVEGDPSALRWVVPPGLLTARGRVTSAPPPLDAFLAGGDVAEVEAASDAVTIRLAPGRSWRELGPRVRTALGEALRDPQGWVATQGHIEGPDAALTEAAAAAIAGEAGDYVRSHGGHIELVAAHDGRVDVRLTGACGHCAAATATLRFRVEAAVRQAYPDLVEVRQVS
ncbi:NifU family protein [Mobilicoccus pelagius]|uniref:NIF system FeS cluster assembly NifU C-terminal domain-containing protein n=1 Tax=Mobilicoccus pelagius NBRC 104925 TaxID=1089455 RepID=H5UVX1_9MICO|nr:NifU family protein [Mobilicoccus pelagius]GAB49879.1 hypothetical protein MOPEL_135_01170 [Mobilicoccus pelagius NBRC 104925]